MQLKQMFLYCNVPLLTKLPSLVEKRRKVGWWQERPKQTASFFQMKFAPLEVFLQSTNSRFLSRLMRGRAFKAPLNYFLISWIRLNKQIKVFKQLNENDDGVI